MSKIEEMIKRLCPNGVERVPVWRYTAWDKKFNAVDKSMQKSINKYKYLLAKDLEEIKDNSGDIRILYTTEEIAYTTEEKAGNYISEGEVIAIPWGGTPSVKYYKGRFITGDNRIATSTDAEKLSNKYLYYVLLDNMKTISKFYRGAGIKHPSMYSILTLEIPLPPLTIQREIVSVLDSFTTLIDKMKQEVELRKKQMEYYREKLLLFDEHEAGFVKIKDLFDTKNGYTPSTKNPDFWTDKGIPWVKMEDIRENGTVLSDSAKHITMSAIKGSKLFNANSIILATSATIGIHALVKVPHLSNQRFTNIYPKKEYENKIDMKYAYYYFFKIDRWCKEHVTLGNFAGVNMSDFYDYDFPVPPLSTQRSIVSTLDAFEQYISKLERLITLHEKQYAYYREKLLTFE